MSQEPLPSSLPVASLTRYCHKKLHVYAAFSVNHGRERSLYNILEMRRLGDPVCQHVEGEPLPISKSPLCTATQIGEME